MAKLTRKDKIKIYGEYKAGKSLKSLSYEYKIRISNIYYFTKLIDYHGIDILKETGKRYYSPEHKEEIIRAVLIEKKTVLETALHYGLRSYGMLFNWIREYKANNYVIVERKQGRPTTMTKTKQPQAKTYTEMTLEEKIKYLEDKNLYLEAENEYLKKLDAVIKKNKKLKEK